MRENEQPVDLGESRRVRLGASVMLAALLTGVGIGMCRWVPSLRPWLAHITAGLCVLGVGFLLVRWISHLQEDTEDRVLRFHRNPGYWGVSLLVAAGVTFVTVSLLYPQLQEVRARVHQADPASEVEFPELKINGVVLNGARSSAVIGGRAVWVGEFVEGVRVLRIFEDGVVVEREGVRRAYFRKTTHTAFNPSGEVLCAGGATNNPAPRAEPPQKPVTVLLPAK